MTLEEFANSEEVAPAEISKVFAGSGLMEQFNHQLSSGAKEIKISYLKPESFRNKDGEHSYFSIYQVLVDRFGNITERIKKC
jgi:hypothetical protein